MKIELSNDEYVDLINACHVARFTKLDSAGWDDDEGNHREAQFARDAAKRYSLLVEKLKDLAEQQAIHNFNVALHQFNNPPKQS